MGTTELPLDSREYKLMLSTTRFHNRQTASDEWMEVVRDVIVRQGGVLVPQEELDKDVEKRRRAWFLDTAVGGFGELGWILRVRKEKESDFNLTLKFRSPDRYVSAAQELAASAGHNTEVKFEEDVLPPFAIQYSHSNKIKKLKQEPAPQTVEAAAQLFPVLDTLGIPGNTPLRKADDFEAREVVLQVGGFRFGDGPAIKMSQTFWYPAGIEASASEYPLVAEFSFDFEAAKEGDRFPLATVSGADAVFRRLQAQAGWMDVSGTTKSALVAAGL
ncbi:MAG TPA: hypothetical protein VEQ60_17360 [Longimicrobium sp.]|nr:hypothetical protein [Longimicrobium sp.]